MKCPVCKKSVENFREHAFGHVRADEAYVVETWDPQTASAKLVLYPLLAPLVRGEIKPLQKKFETPDARLLTRGRLQVLEWRRKVRRRRAS
jgi:hypothetical protein